MVNPKQYQVIVVGAGPAGYVAAIRAAQLGFKTACVESRDVLGGTCLNEGCIPSKALLDSSERYAQLSALSEHGIAATDVSMNIKQMMARKQAIVKQLTSGVEGLLRGNSVDWIHARAQIMGGRKVQCVDSSGEAVVYEPDAVIIASGSIPFDIGAAAVDNKHVFDSTGALEFKKAPKRLGIIGAGVIGLELGSVWARLGSEVVLLEALDDFLPMVDKPIGRIAQSLFKSQKLDIRLGCRVVETVTGSKGVKISYQSGAEEHLLEVDTLVVAVGRKPATEGMLADDSGVELDERGTIFVDEYCQTSVSGVYAIGDVVRGPMLAHKGMEEGVMVAERLAGQASTINYNLIPSVIYTHPEVAWVGETEEMLKSRKVPYRSGKFPFAASGRALASAQSEGQVRVLTAEEDGRLLGVHVIGQGAAEIVQQAAIAMEFGACSEDLASMVFSHPTVSETLHEAVLATEGRALHILNRTSGKKPL